MGFLRSIPILAGGLLAGGLVTGAMAAPRLRGVLPPNITIHSASPRYEAAQTRLASFINRLQTGKRRDAAKLMSSRVTPTEREAMVEKKWLRYQPWQHADLMQALYWPDIEIFTKEGSLKRVDLQITKRNLPAVNKKTSPPAGLLVIPMRLENGSWFVDLHPAR